MGVHHQLDRVGDHFAADQRGLHALVSHRDPVAHRDADKFARRAPGFADTGLAELCQFVQAHIARGRLVPGACYADERLGEVRIAESHGSHKRACRARLLPFVISSLRRRSATIF